MPQIPIRRALISVYDKTGVADFARALHDEFNIEIISTGGTATLLRDAGVPVTLVEEITGFPEMLDGRVKTLHPKIHAAILADRDNPEHMRQLAEQGIEPIDMVVVNLYPFEDTIAREGCTRDEAIEMIDIGGPCLLRAAAKNHKHVLVVSSPEYYGVFLDLVRKWDEDAHRTDALETGAFNAFMATSGYDAKVAEWLSADDDGLPMYRLLRFFSWGPLRYGENPHQAAELLSLEDDPDCDLLQVAETHAPNEELEALGDDQPMQPRMSTNNYVDADAALQLCAELDRASLSDSTPLQLPRIEESRTKEPRTSDRAADQNTTCSDPWSFPDPKRPAWLLTWTTYGTWLPGDERGFVGRAPNANRHEFPNEPDSPFAADQPELSEAAKSRMTGAPVLLTQEQAGVVAETLEQTATTHAIAMIALSVMPNHVHLLCQADQDGSELLRLFKGGSSRSLGQRFGLKSGQRWWTKSGSKRHIQRGENLATAHDYVVNQKGAFCVLSFQDTARTEVRGSLGEGIGDRERVACCVFIKHTNACGVGVHADPVEAFRRAYMGDANAAMGGILAVNFPVDRDFADVVMNSLSRWGKDAGAGAFFVEVWIAPQFDDDAIEHIASAKSWGKRVRTLSVGDMDEPPHPDTFDIRQITGGALLQSRDLVGLNEDQWKVVTKRQPSEREMADLRLAWLVCKHTKSNAISICKDGMLIGNGAGQMSRVMSCRIATWLANDNGHADKLAGSVAASDAFFPFRDGPDVLMDAGVTAIIQPGGSKRDADTITACDERGVAMVFTGTRHFKH